MDQSAPLRLVSPNFSDILTPNIEIGTFPDGDSHVHIPHLNSFKGKEITLFHRLYPHQNHSFMELFLVLDALNEVGAKVTVVSPYLPYARQHKKLLEGEVASADVVCRMLRMMGCEKFVTFDCHFLNEEGESEYCGLKIQNHSLSKALVAHAKQVFGGEGFEIIGPDQGANYLVKQHGGQSMKKVRQDYKDNTISYRNIEKLEGELDVEGKNVLILDDMISTGSTMIKALERMKECGAKKICCAASHGLFLHDSLERLQALAEKVFVSDSIPSPVSAVSIKDQLSI
ncbi:MAG: ribose-phosphate diphosphokinase [Patescibacteria group bacterium]|nr:ribose-phosphate diphosphokinase [Patescibacteria group bacterium]